MASTTMTHGDEVVFDRLDLADALGIWSLVSGHAGEGHDRERRRQEHLLR
jgi:hypothetical protein